MDTIERGDGGSDPGAERALLRRRDVRLLALLASARFEDPSTEARRITLLRDVNRTGRAASRRFGEYTRHTVSETWGSRSAWNVAADAEAFFTAMADYCAAVERISAELEALAAQWQAAGADDEGTP